MGSPAPEVSPEAERGCPRFSPASGVEMGQKEEVTPDSRSPRESWGNWGFLEDALCQGSAAGRPHLTGTVPAYGRRVFQVTQLQGLGLSCPAGWLVVCCSRAGRVGRGRGPPGRKEGGREGGNKEEVAYCLPAAGLHL